jgi:hypothetical protein
VRMSEDGSASYQKSGGASSVHGGSRLPSPQSAPYTAAAASFEEERHTWK